jgi:hypothetical protein
MRRLTLEDMRRHPELREEFERGARRERAREMGRLIARLFHALTARRARAPFEKLAA